MADILNFRCYNLKITHLKYVFFDLIAFYKKIFISRKRCSVENLFLFCCKLVVCSFILSQVRNLMAGF
jgi:hypothetical protein